MDVTDVKVGDNSCMYGALSLDEVESNWDALLRRAPSDFYSFAARFSMSTVRDDGIVLGFKEAPAGKGIHHAYRGGLVQHLLEGLDTLQNFEHEYPNLNHTAMLYGWLLHDAHKAYFHYIQRSDGKLDYLDHSLTKLYTQNQKTVLMVSINGDGFLSSPLVHNILNCSEGGWAENPPKEASVEAKLVYIADELSVVKNRIEQGRACSIYDRKPSWFDTGLDYE